MYRGFQTIVAAFGYGGSGALGMEYININIHIFICMNIQYNVYKCLYAIYTCKYKYIYMYIYVYINKYIYICIGGSKQSSQLSATEVVGPLGTGVRWTALYLSSKHISIYIYICMYIYT
jgi:hypothetical protein